MVLRKASLSEVEFLNKLAYESEGFWGEDQAYMTAFSKDYALTEKMVSEDHVYVMEDGPKINGFFAILNNPEGFELELFYVDRSLIGKGYGTRLWRMMVDKCSEIGISSFNLVASEDVEGFYRQLGAREVKRIPSILQEGRVVVVFEYSL